MSIVLDGTNGVTYPSGSTQNAACVAWANFNGTLTGTNAPRASYNVSSITRVSAGTYTVTFANALVDTNYAVAGQCANTGDTAGNTSRSIGVPSYSTGSFTLICTIGTASANDFTYVNFAVFR